MAARRDALSARRGSDRMVFTGSAAQSRGEEKKPRQWENRQERKALEQARR